MAVRREDARQLEADACRSAGYERDGAAATDLGARLSITHPLGKLFGLRTNDARRAAIPQ